MLRIEIVEIVVKSPRGPRLTAELRNLSQLVARARALSRRLLELERVGKENLVSCA